MNRSLFTTLFFLTAVGCAAKTPNVCVDNGSPRLDPSRGPPLVVIGAAETGADPAQAEALATARAKAELEKEWTILLIRASSFIGVIEPNGMKLTAEEEALNERVRAQLEPMIPLASQQASVSKQQICEMTVVRLTYDWRSALAEVARDVDRVDEYQRFLETVRTEDKETKHAGLIKP